MKQYLAIKLLAEMVADYGQRLEKIVPLAIEASTTLERLLAKDNQVNNRACALVYLLKEAAGNK